MNGQQVNAWEYPATPENVARLQQVVTDLETVHDYRSTNTQRLQAQSVPSLFPSLLRRVRVSVVCFVCVLLRTNFSDLTR
jgi:hypothetical protein